MTQVERLERDIVALDAQSFDQKRWDKQLAEDAHAGKLDFLIDAALAEHQAGLSKPL
jgi:hypothetical protein